MSRATKNFITFAKVAGMGLLAYYCASTCSKVVLGAELDQELKAPAIQELYQDQLSVKQSYVIER